MAEAVFEQEGLKIIKFCGVVRSDGRNRTRYELTREFDKHDILGNSSMTLSADQMAALIMGFRLADEELVLTDREILPISERKFGVVITEEENISLLRSGYKVITLPVPSKRKKGDVLQHHIEVYISAHDLKDDKEEARFDIPLLETVGRATVAVSPVPWRVGGRTGVKAYAKSIEIGI